MEEKVPLSKIKEVQEWQRIYNESMYKLQQEFNKSILIEEDRDYD